jgi:hypothetical protein
MVLACASVAATACSTAAPAPTVRLTAPARPSATARASGGAAIGTEAVYSFFPATGGQFSAGAKYIGTKAVLSGLLMDECLARYGFSPPAHASSSIVTLTADYVDNSQFPDLARIAREKRFIPVEPGPPATAPSLSPSRLAAYQADTRTCANANPLAAVAVAAYDLERQWWDGIKAIQASSPVRAKLPAFAACMEQAGVPADAAGTLGDFEDWLTGVMSRTPAGDFLAAQAHWTALFVPCATPVVSTQEALQLTAQRQFMRQHAAKIAALRSLVADAVATAERQTGKTGDFSAGTGPGA